MADIRRDSFNEANRLTKVLIQTGRFLQEYELNEMQDDLRVSAYRLGQALQAGDAGYLQDGVAWGWRIYSTGAANVIRATGPGVMLADGYVVRIAADIVLGGLTTPSAPRTDIVYLQIQEIEVADPDPDPILGVTSYRRQLSVELKIVEGGVMPASTGDPWMGGVYRVQLATINRLAAAPVVLNTWIEQNFRLLPGRVGYEVAAILDGYVGHLYAGTQGYVESTGVGVHLGLVDATMATRLLVSDSGNAVVNEATAGVRLRGRFGFADTAAAFSLIRMVNGRAFTTVGDGVATFGDFNGADGVKRAVAAMNGLPAGVACTIVVKSGTYVADDASGPVIPTRMVRIQGESSGLAGSVVIQNKQTADFPIFSSAFILELENLNIDCSIVPAAYRSVVATGGLRVQNCQILGTVDIQGVYGECYETQFSGTGNHPALRPGAGVALDLAHLLVHNCGFSINGGEAPLVSFLPSGGGLVVEAQFRDCRFTLSPNTSAAPVLNRGIFSLNDTGVAAVYMDKLTFENCRFSTTNGINSHFLKQTIGVGADGVTATTSLIREIRFSECTFSHGDNIAGMGAFYLADQNPPNYATRLRVSNCRVLMGVHKVDVEAGATKGAAYALLTSSVEVDGLEFTGIPDVLFSSAVGAGPGTPLALVWAGFPGAGAVRCHLSRISFGSDDISHVPGGTLPRSWLYLDGAISPEVEKCSINYNPGGGVLNPTEGMVSISNLPLPTFSDCVFFQEQTAAGVGAYIGFNRASKFVRCSVSSGLTGRGIYSIGAVQCVDSSFRSVAATQAVLCKGVDARNCSFTCGGGYALEDGGTGTSKVIACSGEVYFNGPTLIFARDNDSSIRSTNVGVTVSYGLDTVDVTTLGTFTTTKRMRFNNGTLTTP